MAKYLIPYYKDHLEFEIDDSYVNGILSSKAEDYTPLKSQIELVKEALENPINSKRLSELAINKKHIVIISSDHTRPVPSSITMPLILEEIRRTNPSCRITILVATGMHRPTTKDELIAKYGLDIVNNEKIVVHDAYNDNDMAYMGILPSGGELWVNKLANSCDLLISEGFIEPHFFAGFSGGRKSILPGIASKKTVLWNHNAKFIASPYSRSGNLESNPIHKDMLFAAKQCNLSFILNVVLNSEKKIIAAFSGNVEKAHHTGCEFVNKLSSVDAIYSDIVITSNGGYPLDQNVYQTVKGLKTAYQTVNDNGVIIMVSSCCDGHGGESIYKLISEAKSIEECLNSFLVKENKDTEFDQWEAQILASILLKTTVIIVSTHCSKTLINDMHMIHATSIDEALEIARTIKGKDSKITIVPDGISVIVK